MADGLRAPDEGDYDDELDAEDLADVLGGGPGVPPLDDTNSGCTVNGNCGCTA